MTSSADDLRNIVAEVVKETVAGLVANAVREAAPDIHAKLSPPPRDRLPHRTNGANNVNAPTSHTRTDDVRIANNSDLEQFVRHLLALFENPKNRQDLKAGRWRFRYLPPLGLSAPAGGGVTRIERGAVTERQIKAAAKSNHTVVLGRRAVLTPLGRDTARALGVVVEKER